MLQTLLILLSFALTHVFKYKLLYLLCYNSKFYGLLNTLKLIDIYSEVKIKGSTKYFNMQMLKSLSILNLRPYCTQYKFVK